MDLVTVSYLGQNEFIRTLIASSGGKAVAILQDGRCLLWFLDTSEIPVPMKGIKILSRQESDSEVVFATSEKIDMHHVPTFDLPDVKLVEWSEGRDLLWLKIHAPEKKYSESEARAAYFFHKKMLKIYPDWSRESIKDCWLKSKHKAGMK